ncbi:Uncharacterised protein [Mycobacteroides abscessus subsp. abscessus]|nr:Uncharacterised protein [Mycobacteroides abscessus subsp. abscessus]
MATAMRLDASSATAIAMTAVTSGDDPLAWRADRSGVMTV